MEQPKLKIGYLAIGLAVLLLVIAFFMSSGGGRDIDVVPEGTNLDTSTHAYIVDGDELVQEIGSLDGFDSLGRDLYVFGKTAYEPYKSNPDRVVGFEITSSITTSDNHVIFEGRFGSSDNKIEVDLSKLNNNKVSTSITDVGTGLNLDDSLPSNSELNVFYGNLPISGDGYNIVYLSGDKVSINIYLRDPNIYNKAYAKIVETVGKSNADKLDLSVLFPTPSFSE